MGFKLGKHQKLKGKTAISELFRNGKSIRKGAMRFVYTPILSESVTEHRIGFVIPKRYVKKAVDRNRIKRLMREAYRLYQHDLKSEENIYLKGMFIYQSNKIPDFDHIEKLCRAQIKEVSKRLNTNL
ncbi:MAG: ribonuclease P protein component [Nonlabens sp.]